MKKSAKPVVRKKPCPYCGKKLQAINKRKWRNNLARHLGNACPPYEREVIKVGLRIVGEFVSRIGTLGMGDYPFRGFPIPEDPAKRAKDISELERMVNLPEDAQG